MVITLTESVTLKIIQTKIIQQKKIDSSTKKFDKIG